MSVGQILDILSKRAPVIAALAFANSLLGKWTSAPVLPFYILAVVVGLMALALATTRVIAHIPIQRGARIWSQSGLIAYLFYEGRPRGFLRLSCSSAL
ncbi:MAG: hypothetical protein IPO50_12550 [Sphingomonadales bacterium]|nr:hypothetical protein [Sphingomonadales bacterium]